LDLLTQFDSSQMAFNPSIQPPPKDTKVKAASGRHNFKLKDVEELCSRKRKLDESSAFNFYSDFESN
jgi:hypothetical protein